MQKEIFPKDSVSLGAISDNASTRAMAGSIISSYNPQDRCVVWASWKCLRCGEPSGAVLSGVGAAGCSLAAAGCIGAVPAQEWKHKPPAL